MKKTFKFNLVEIALAIAIVAIGISSIMAIFPAGINATNDAVADNNIPDVAEYVLSYLEASTIAGWRKSTAGNPAQDSNDFLTSSGISLKDSVTDSSLGDKTVESDRLMKVEDDGSVQKFALLNNSADGIFLFRQTRQVDTGAATSELFVDFAAVVTVIRRPYIADYSLAGTAVAEEISSADVSRVISYEIEISYPAERPYSVREKVLYRLNVFNQSKEN